MTLLDSRERFPRARADGGMPASRAPAPRTRATSYAAPTRCSSDGCEGLRRAGGARLLATGERARKRTVEPREHLTAQEAGIARLAGEGFSNPDIGARLISPKTVEYHLRKVFSKLGITSRTPLDRGLLQRTDVALRV